jgi:hypothetical protein
MTDTPLGPRPRIQPSWAEQQRQRRKKPLWRLLNRSFTLRILIAISAAGLLLGSVNRWEHCRQNGFKSGCFVADPGGIINISNIEALSIVSAAFLYLLESGQRRQRQHLQAMEVIQACHDSGARFSHARNEALETLSASGLWLDGLNLSGAELEEIQAPHARWRGVNLQGANLRNACLHDADLRESNLQEADLRGADLSHCDLREANLTGASLEGAFLDGALMERAEGANQQLNSQS